MVRSDIGSTLIPECARHTGDGIHYLKISGSQARRQIALFWRKSSAKAVICEEIADEVRNIMRD